MIARRISVALASLALTAGSAVALAAPAHAGIMEGNCRYSYRSPYLSVGDTDASTTDGWDRPVSQAQCELNSVLKYTYVATDGSFGQQTHTGTVLFQRCAGIADDGIIGPVTWSNLDSWFDKGWRCYK
ncbi:peptidoglycan-binding protein [Kitasatospora sp. NPDC101155]|uniref:peptidoglycan-binding domain-containing protein n=1 Tax=Kitasatospora sp. NPDC101155 TaxID=3364097 RepID=UPI003820D63D